MDALCGTGADQCAAHGGKRGFQRKGLLPDRSLYAWIHPAVSGSRDLYREIIGSVQEAYESGKIHGEGGRRPYDPDGPSHVYGKDERYHRISVHKYAGVCR